MNDLSAVNTSCQESVRDCGVDQKDIFAAEQPGLQTYTATTGELNQLPEGS